MRSTYISHRLEIETRRLADDAFRMATIRRRVAAGLPPLPSQDGTYLGGVWIEPRFGIELIELLWQQALREYAARLKRLQPRVRPHAR